jgi:hypothetical protein
MRPVRTSSPPTGPAEPVPVPHSDWISRPHPPGCGRFHSDPLRRSSIPAIVVQPSRFESEQSGASSKSSLTGACHDHEPEPDDEANREDLESS